MMKLYDQCLLFLINDDQERDLHDLPIRIQDDIQVLRNLHHVLCTLRNNMCDKEDLESQSDWWEYTRDTLELLCEFNCGDCAEGLECPPDNGFFPQCQTCQTIAGNQILKL